MNSSVLAIKNPGFNVLDREETQSINGGVIIVGFAIALAAVAIVGAVATPVVYRDLKSDSTA